MKKNGQYTNKHHPLFRALKSTGLMLILLGYLVVPFKQQFLDSIHLASHLALFETPYHTHDHSHENANHQHGFLEIISQATNDQASTTPIPVVLVNYQFQVPLPVDLFNLTLPHPAFLETSIQLLFIPILKGPSFDVPTPPP